MKHQPFARAPRIAALLAFASLSGCALFKDDLQLNPPSSIAAPSLRPFADGTNWILERDLVFTFRDWPAIRVPAGFVTDLASVPSIAQSIRSRVGTYSRAAILHDYLYATGVCQDRYKADIIFYHAMKTSGSSDMVARQVYFAVSKFGAKPYAANEQERKDGLPRILRPDQFALADSNGWIALRKTLPRVKPDSNGAAPAYCAMGNNKPAGGRRSLATA